MRWDARDGMPKGGQAPTRIRRGALVAQAPCALPRRADDWSWGAAGLSTAPREEGAAYEQKRGRGGFGHGDGTQYLRGVGGERAAGEVALEDLEVGEVDEAVDVEVAFGPAGGLAEVLAEDFEVGGVDDAVEV